MKMKILKSVFIVLSAVFLMSTLAQADNEKNRMIKRLPVINQLKAQGLIGENKIGLLEYRGANQPNPDVINAENADRMAVYSQIAKKQKASAQQVGARRAIQIAGKAKPGTWLQKPDGSWYQK
jgi:uncharacterized protein